MVDDEGRSADLSLIDEYRHVPPFFRSIIAEEGAKINPRNPGGRMNCFGFLKKRVITDAGAYALVGPFCVLPAAADAQIRCGPVADAV